MVGRVAQLAEQLCEYSGRGQLGKRRRDDYDPPRDDDYDRSRGRGVYGPARGHAERQEGRYGDRYRDGREESDEEPYEGASYRAEGFEMTGIGMAAVVLRLGAGMAPAVTGVLVLLLKISSSDKPTP